MSLHAGPNDRDGRRPTPSDVLADLEADLDRRPDLEIDTEALIADRDAGRPQ